MKDIWNIRKQYLLNIIKTIFLSFEFFITIVMFILYFLRIIPFDEIGNFLFKDKDIMLGITLALPISLFIASLRIQKILLEPEDNNKILYNWPDYKKYRTTTIVGVIFCSLPILPTFISWARFSYYCKYDIGFYYVLLLLVSIISITSLLFSRYEIKRILQK